MTGARYHVRYAAPWDLRTVRLLIGFNVLGGVMLMVAWEWSRNQVTLKEQYGSMNLAMLGLIVAAVGQVGWIIAARRSVVLRQRSALARVVAAAPRRGHDASEPQEAAGSVWVQVPGTRRGHRAQCQLVAGKAVVGLTRADVADRDVLSCEECS